MQIIKAVSCLALLTILTGCPGPQPRKVGLNPGSTPGFTGAKNPDGIPYTTGNEPRATAANVASLQLGKPLTEEQQKNLLLAESIRSLSWTRFNSSDQKTFENPVRYSLQMEIVQYGMSRSLNFEGSITTVTSQTMVETTTDQADSRYSLSGVCQDAHCKSSAELTLTYKTTYENGDSHTSTTPIYVRGFASDVNLRSRLNTTSLSPELHRKIELLDDTKVAWVTHLVVPGGPSFYEVSAFRQVTPSIDSNDSDITVTITGVPNELKNQEDGEDSELEHILTLYGPALKTNHRHQNGEPATPIPAKVQDPGAANPAKATLIGNGAGRDILTFAVQVKDNKGQTEEVVLDVRSFDERAQKAEIIDGEHLKGVTENSYYQTPYSDEHPQIKKIVNDLEANWALDGVQEWISKWKKGGPGHDQLAQHFKYAYPVRKITEAIYTAFELPTGLEFNTINESQYFYGGQYLIQGTNSSDAFGPHQLKIDTALDQGLRVDVDTTTDERAYYATSACGAASYFAFLNRHYFQGSDATMMLHAYRIGQTKTAVVAQCFDSSAPGACVKQKSAVKRTKVQANLMLKHLLRHNFSFVEVVERDMLDEDLKKYIFHTLSLYFVAGDPERYGFDLEQLAASAPAKTPDNLLPPGGPSTINSGQCREIIEDLNLVN